MWVWGRGRVLRGKGVSSSDARVESDRPGRWPSALAAPEQPGPPRPLRLGHRFEPLGETLISLSGLRGDEDAQSTNRNMVAKTAKTATNVESNARHSPEGWWDLCLIDDRNEWAVTTLAMTFLFVGGDRARHQRNRCERNHLTASAESRSAKRRAHHSSFSFFGEAGLSMASLDHHTQV